MTKRLKKGHAYREYLLVSSEIEELTASGYDLKSIYNKLFEAKRITMSYPALWENINRAKKKKAMKENGQAASDQTAKTKKKNLVQSPAPSTEPRAAQPVSRSLEGQALNDGLSKKDFLQRITQAKIAKGKEFISQNPQSDLEASELEQKIEELI